MDNNMDTPRPTPPTEARPENQPGRAADMLKSMYSVGVDEMWFEQHNSEPDRDSEDFKKFMGDKLSPIDFENRQGWQKNAELEKSLSEAAGRRLKRLMPDKS